MTVIENSSTKYWHCSFPVVCECGAKISSNSIFKHRKSKKHINEMEKPENEGKQPNLKFFNGQ